MIDAELRIRTGTVERTVALASYLDAAGEESAHRAEYEWIKRLRHMDVDGETFRDRFAIRGDSLWWFSEIYLHKQQVILDIHRALAAFDALVSAERPTAVGIARTTAIVHHVLSFAANARGIRGIDPVDFAVWQTRLRSLSGRARRLTWAARLSPQRWRRPPRRPHTPVAAFVHRAFWRGGDDGSAESYIGPVMKELEAQLGPAAIHYVGIGPSENFRARRRWAGTARHTTSVVPIERYAGRRQLTASSDVWRNRDRHLRAMAASRALRDAAMIRGVDCWRPVYEQLAGIAWLQWPWSVRAMDEAAAALESIEPDMVLTYAEAGGWGRALILEARRRRIASAGLQHGFIYRHWLNYRHEPDEMIDGRTPGFPAPSRTLLFDAFAADHLRSAGCFDDAALVVTGSPRLDELWQTLSVLPPDAIAATRRELALGDDDRLVLLVTKEREARPWLRALYEAVASVKNAVLVVKPHPAETEEAYASAMRQPHIRVVSPASPLAPLLACAGVVVTVNSTVALDAAVLNIPGLAMALPNNLSPFVERGVLAGTADPAALGELLGRILYDEGFRQQLSDHRRTVMGQHAMRADGRAAARCAGVIRELARQRKGD